MEKGGVGEKRGREVVGKKGKKETSEGCREGRQGV